MPPRIVKRGAAAKRASRGSSKAAPENQHEPEEVVVKNNEENSVVDVGVEEKPVDVKQEHEEVPNGSAKVENNEEEVKESIDEYEKDEHLDLEDNYPEYEPEEYGGVDYDEKEIEQDEGQEEGDEVDEDPEEYVVEEEGDTGDEVEYVYEEVEDDDDEHAGVEHEHDEHAQMPNVEEEEHREVVKERQKRKEFEVFVGGLDKDATEHDLRKVFSKVGVVTEVRLMINPQTKRNKGFAFLRFETVEQAKRAVTELKNPVINGKQCGVTPSQDSDTLYIGNICKTWKKEAVSFYLGLFLASFKA
ncbi:Heterogeneous nuclear ribonucleoprotein Q [Spatholobus suberectus]|nr:Heterogeneous nuclear ribonucleoprotein Q [Spatholobus suberectus]